MLFIKNLKIIISKSLSLKEAQIITAISVCLLLSSLFAVQYFNSTKPMEDAVSFDSTNVLSNELNAGWVDNISDLSVGINQDFTLSGWAIDPFLVTPASEVILVSENRIIPTQLNWYERIGLPDVFNTNSVLMSGFILTANSHYFSSNSINNIDIYAVTKDNKYIKLQVSSPINISKNRTIEERPFIVSLLLPFYHIVHLRNIHQRNKYYSNPSIK